ncbi:hypothetical protein [Yeguia hominis]|uniref:Uncharacterized protein n=1 Tax=Yeguia hominis TaxID=2763662 RepID=A0A926D9V4_9FIRM|nr:hypothetical protein [Yeguia hominis]MBC8535060.1 hypothetical protein [Yeguia hominis]
MIVMNVCEKCHGIFEKKVSICPKCNIPLIDYDDFLHKEEKEGENVGLPKCPVCGSYYLIKNPAGGSPYVHHSFACHKCGYRF